MAVIEDPIINSPFEEPQRHHELDERGNPTGAVIAHRRRSTHLTAIPQPKRQSKAQAELFPVEEKEEENQTINQIRYAVSLWRQRNWPHVTRVTRQLLEYWTAEDREKRLFFCQFEAVETAIYLTEVAKREKQDWIDTALRKASDEANPGLYRIALKMATGSGKTVVMAMLIAWQTLNKITNPSDPRFTDAFLIVTPGVTIRDRLRVLLPQDAENYYKQRDLVPSTSADQLYRARIAITNYHAFLLRETVDAATLTKNILKGSGPNPFTETPAQMARRVCRDLGDAKNILVINDEAHHCYDRKVDATDAAPKGDLAKEVEERRVWVNGIRAVQEKIGVRAVYDLSATPFFLAGSGYPEGQLFPWVVSDFALIDSIESGIVKIPRLPVADDAMQGESPIYRDLWTYIGKDLPKKKSNEAGARPSLPKELEGALVSLYGSYKQQHALWAAQQQALDSGEAAQASQPPPVMIVVCNNTLVSKMVFDWISGYEQPHDDVTVIVPGNLDLFRNESGERWLPRPKTILVDSQQLESGDAMSDDFKKVAAREIDVFKAEFRQRYPDRDPEDLTDHDLLREVMNTVGKSGKLGEGVKCVVSVSMLTEGWDVNSVTHILGVRAFSTQLICEQVVGRALRRVSYVPNEKGMFDAEYAEVYGVPFSFLPTAGTSKSPRLPKVPTHIQAMPEREGAEFRFPNVIGYRYDLKDEPLRAGFGPNSRMVLTAANLPTYTENAALFGESEFHTLAELYRRREKEVIFKLAKEVLERYFRDEGGATKVWYFPQILRIVEQWIDSGNLALKDGCQLQLLLLAEYRATAVEKIYLAIVFGTGATERLKLILDADAPVGSSSTIDYETTKSVYRTDPKKCQVNYVASDSGWEDKMANTLERMPEVLAYIKNAGMNLRVPYTLEGSEHDYIPDFIVRVNAGLAEPLNLIVEVTGERIQRREEKEAKAETMRSLWVPGVNALGSFGRWDYIEILDPWDGMTSIRRQIQQIKMTETP